MASGFQRRKARVEAGLPRYTEAEAERRREADRARVNARRVENVERARSIKMERGCADCGYNAHPEALDFDHLPGTVKKFALSRVSGLRLSWERVEAEIAKCEVVCANCHRIRTARRREQAVSTV